MPPGTPRAAVGGLSSHSTRCAALEAAGGGLSSHSARTAASICKESTCFIGSFGMSIPPRAIAGLRIRLRRVPWRIKFDSKYSCLGIGLRLSLAIPFDSKYSCLRIRLRWLSRLTRRFGESASSRAITGLLHTSLPAEQHARKACCSCVWGPACLTRRFSMLKSACWSPPQFVSFRARL